MMVPTVNPNGTSKERLLEVAMDAQSKIISALTALQSMYPARRDYDNDGDAALAVHEHDLRLGRIQSLAGELHVYIEILSKHRQP